MKQLLFAFMLLASIKSNGQDKKDTTSLGSVYFTGTDTSKVLHINSSYLSTVTLMGEGSIKRMDTVPVMMMVSDTAVGKDRQIWFNNSEPKYYDKYVSFYINDSVYIQSKAPYQMYPVLIFGYSVTDSYTWKTTYLTSNKEAIPDRFIVWMSKQLN